MSEDLKPNTLKTKIEGGPIDGLTVDLISLTNAPLEIGTILPIPYEKYVYFYKVKSIDQDGTVILTAPKITNA